MLTLILVPFWSLLLTPDGQKVAKDPLRHLSGDNKTIIKNVQKKHKNATRKNNQKTHF